MSQNKKSSNTFVIVLTLLVFASIAVFVVLSSNNQKENEPGTEFSQQPSLEEQPRLGEEDAPVKVVEFGDFKCPACKAWGESIYPQLVDDYVESGQVEFGYINVLFHGQESTLGSAAAEAVLQLEPESYWDFHKKLFAEQPANDHDTVWLTMDKIHEVAAETTNITAEDLEAEMQTEAVMEEVNKDNSLVQEYEIQLTPTIMVNEVMIEDPFDYEKIKSVIDEALEDQK
ncbi:DsbA family protein [Cytobacillus gottheilii]|uniref:DsbA family protein n=1 Tax=Cytobacillus gottheilii TaxID=859144 RepID=UPI0009BB9D62|nr:thioredoxin domain-containing protein [Cytobacillus gottheilii]